MLGFGVFPLVLPSAIAALGDPEGYFSLEIRAFGAFAIIVPPSPHSGQNAFFRGGGWGVYILRGARQEFYTPPTPRRVFSGVGGWGCIKFSPVPYSRGFVNVF